MKSTFEAALFPLAFVALLILFSVRTIPAMRNPAARLSWLGAGVGALGTLTLGEIVPLKTLDGWLGGTNLIYLPQCICATLAFWMLTQTAIRRGGLSTRNWTSLVAIVVAFSVPFLFIDRHRTSATFTHDNVHQFPMLLCTGLYLGGLVYMCISLLYAIRKREKRGYWPFIVGAGLVIAGCATEASFMTLAYLKMVGGEVLAIGYLFFTPLFFPGVLFIVGGVVSFSVRRHWRDRELDSLIVQLTNILRRGGIPAYAVPETGDRSTARLLHVLALDVEVRDREAIQKLALTEPERKIVHRAEKVLAKQLTVPSSAELWSVETVHPSRAT